MFHFTIHLPEPLCACAAPRYEWGATLVDYFIRCTQCGKRLSQNKVTAYFDVPGLFKAPKAVPKPKTPRRARARPRPSHLSVIKGGK